MEVTIEWHGKTFNVGIASKEGADAFLLVKGCRISTTNAGECFVSWPATKNEKTGKWWNHCWASDKFNYHVLDLAMKSKPSDETPSKTGGLENIDDDIPW